MRSINFFGLTAIITVVLMTLGTAAPAVSQQEKVVHSFGNGKDGYSPTYGLVFDASGNIYGITNGGGAYSFGTVFELSPASGGGWRERVIHSFSNNGIDGEYPTDGPTVDSSGNVYGTTQSGGANGGGIAFELSPMPGGVWAEKVLHSFGSGTDGFTPESGLTLDASGNLFGMTNNGGAYGYGTVFELKRGSGGGWVEKTLHNFNSNGQDGVDTEGSLIFDTSGNLYGTTFEGGLNHGNGGTVFQLMPKAGGLWTEKIIHSFGSGTDGWEPGTGLIFDSTGNLYGATGQGGLYHDGTVFELTPGTQGNWTETILYNFSGPDGAQPYVFGPVFDASGNLYGTTFLGGSFNYGTVFELTPSGAGAWAETVLHDFSGGADGFYGQGLNFDAAGNLLGLTGEGGAYSNGTLYEIKR